LLLSRALLLSHSTTLTCPLPLQSLQGILSDCSSSYGGALTACKDVAQPTLGTLCCSAITALDADCLASILASLSAPGGDATAATKLCVQGWGGRMCLPLCCLA